jgi:predicted signal transduction protein with EAL and GGDEF domain
VSVTEHRERAARYADVARWAAWLYAVAGVLALVSLLLPAREPRAGALHFKQVNDRHGHAAGDDVLARLGALLREVLRDRDLIARYGGEEFVVVLRGAGPRARDVAERIAAAWGAERGLPTLSIGIALQDADASTADTVSRADRALYDAKRAGRDRIRLAEPAVALV